MSIELPEAHILANQMNKELRGKKIKSYRLQDYERLQKIGMLNKDTESFDQIIGGTVASTVSRGNTILVALDNDVDLILAPEYGGEIFYHASGESIPTKFHLKIDFTDGTALIVRLTSMGVINALKSNDLGSSYVFRRDFNKNIFSPLEEGLTLESFSKLMADNSTALKPVLVGKDAVLVGLSNSAFQDVIYRAKLHPKRKASELNKDERKALFNSITLVIQERIRLNGKDSFHDLYGVQGRYIPAMGPNMKQRACPRCGTSIEMLSLGGGQVYICPSCQV
jgi:formamidopyrimidine-DNA glycosylase